MANDARGAKIEHWFHVGALTAALLCIPAVFMQASKSDTLHDIGNLLSLAIWIFFVVGVTALLRLASDNWAWIRGHKRERCVVVGTAPVFSLIGEQEIALGITPLLVIPRMLKVLKFAKFMKLGKLLKVLKIYEKDHLLPKWVFRTVLVMVLILAVRIIALIF